MPNIKKITVVGSGYVGMTLAVLLAQSNEVVIYDIDPTRIKTINDNKSTTSDKKIDEFIKQKNLILSATLDKNIAYNDSAYVIIAVPTNYDSNKNKFDTSIVDKTVEDIIKINKNANIVIKSTLPIGHTKFLQKKYKTESIFFSPEFLREGKALEDNLYPSRIIIGSKLNAGKVFSKLLIDASMIDEDNIETLFVDSCEAEAIKLFSNTYLAMRVSFFNELDSYAMSNKMDTKSIIDGVCLDNRIGKNYNNPSFGYGGYCLPKDTKQLLTNYKDVPQNLIEAIISSNSTRKTFIAQEIIKLNPKVVGIFKLAMKAESKNFRNAAILDIIKELKKSNIEIIIYESEHDIENFHDIPVTRNIDKFKKLSDVIVLNRMDECLNDVHEKCFTRDVYNID